MKDELIQFDTAKLAKEKGFDLEVVKLWANYYEGEPFNKWKLINNEASSLLYCEWKAPTQALLQRWLREVHNINIHVQHWNCMWMFSHQHIKTCHNGISHDNFKDYELALEAGLNEALNTLN